MQTSSITSPQMDEMHQPLDRSRSRDPDPDGELVPLKESANILLLARLQDLRTMSFANFLISICCLVYLAINLTCIVLNGYDNDHYGEAGTDEEDSHGVTSKVFFHNLEFWATFAFAVTEVLALAYSPKPLGSIYKNTLFLKFVIFVNIVLTFVTAMLVSINLEEFETISHEMEYANELTMAMFDLIILFSLLRARGHVSQSKNDVRTSLVIVLIALAIAVAQLTVYNAMGVDEDGDRRGEQAAHYCEFAFEILSAGITFWFCMDNKLHCDQQTMSIMLGDEREVVIQVHRPDVEEVPELRKTLQGNVNPIVM